MLQQSAISMTLGFSQPAGVQLCQLRAERSVQQADVSMRRVMAAMRCCTWCASRTFGFRNASAASDGHLAVDERRVDHHTLQAMNQARY